MCDQERKTKLRLYFVSFPTFFSLFSFSKGKKREKKVRKKRSQLAPDLFFPDGANYLFFRT